MPTKPTGTPAYRPTPGCIWNSFQSSGKKHLLLTGGRGAGKTTLLNGLFPGDTAGLTTRAVPGEAVYLADNRTGQTVQIGIYDASLPGTENLMRPLLSAFEGVGAALLRGYAAGTDAWITIDEIGYLETRSPAYCQALTALMGQKRLAAVVRKQALPFLQQLCSREDVFLVDLDQPFGDLGCVIMASGMGRRFGGNKLMADFQGKPLLRWTLEATEGLFANRIVVTRHEAVRQLCEALAVPCLLHDQPHRSDTVRLGLTALGQEIPGCMFCPGDQPLLSRETIASLAMCAAAAPEDIWRTLCDGNPGSPVIFPRRLFGELLCLPEGKGGSVVVRRHPDEVRLLPVADGRELMDADTPETLAMLASARENEGAL